MGADLSDSVVCDSPETYAGPGGEDISVSGECTDAAGNSTTATFTFDYDDSAPTVTVTPDRVPDHNGWYNHAVIFDTDGTDATSGIASCDPNQTYNDPDGTGLTVSGQCTDNAGNTGTGTSAAFDYDDSAPTVTVTPDRVPDHNGWYNHAVIFDTDGTDATSGIASRDPNQTYNDPDGTGLTVSGQCTDNAGNTGTGTSAAFDYDDSAPTVTVTPDRVPDHNGWYNHAVIFDTDGTDATSGIASCDPNQTYNDPDGTGLTVSGQCTDNAGNTGTGTSAAFDYDDSAPTVTVTPDRVPDHNGWYNHAVIFDTDGTDATSGIASCDPNQTYNDPDGTGLTVSGQCTDNAGNTGTGTSAAFDYDDSAPTITLFSRLPAANLNGWNNSAVTATSTCTDTTSGPVDATVSTTNSGEGFGQFASNHCADNAGNSSVTATVNNIHIDLTDPAIDISSPADGSSTIALVMSISGTATDGLEWHRHRFRQLRPDDCRVRDVLRLSVARLRKQHDHRHGG